MVSFIILEQPLAALEGPLRVPTGILEELLRAFTFCGKTFHINIIWSYILEHIFNTFYNFLNVYLGINILKMSWEFF